MLVAPAQQVLRRDQPIGRAGHAPVALEAGADESLVGQVMAGEERRDPVEERELGERAGRGQEAEDGPLDAVGERDRRGLAIGRVAQPPAAGLDLLEPGVVGPAHLVADERQEPVDRVGGRPARARDPCWRDRLARRRTGGPFPGQVGSGIGVRPAARPGAAIGGRVGIGGPGRRGVAKGAAGTPRGGGIRVGLERREAAQLAGAIQPDQHLAQQALVPCGFATGSQRLDRHLGHGARGLRGRERPLVEALRRGEEPRTRHEVRIAGPARDGWEGHVGAGPRRRRPRGSRGQELDRAADVVLAIRQASAHQPVAGAGTAEDRRAERFGTAIDEEDRPAVAGHDRRRRLERTADGGGLPAPRRAQRGAAEGIDREEHGRLVPEDPGRRVIRRRQPLHARPDGELAEHQPQPRGRQAPSARRGLVLEEAQSGRARQGEDRGRGPLPQAPQVLPEPCLERAERPALEALHEPADEPDGVLEGEPRVALAPLRRGRELDVAAHDPERHGPAGRERQAARREDRVQEREPQGREDRRRPEVALDPVDDGGQPDQLARRVEGEELVDEVLGPVHGGEPAAQLRPDGLDTDIGVQADQVIVVERRLPLLAPATLVAADRATIVLGDRTRLGRGGPGLRGIVGRPGDLVDDERAGAGRAARGVEIAERDLQAGLAPGRRRHPLERGVQVADVGRPQDDVREDPRQRARFERDRPALPVDGGTGHPPAAAEQVGDDVPGARMEVDPRGDDRGRRWRRRPLERGKGEPGLVVGRRGAAAHRSMLADGSRRMSSAIRSGGGPVARRLDGPYGSSSSSGSSSNASSVVDSGGRTRSRSSISSSSSSSSRSSSRSISSRTRVPLV